MPIDQALALWKTQLPLYRRVLDRVRDAVVTPLTRFLPPEFEQKQQQLREELSNRELENYEEYLDVIVENVEGIRNKSIIELADMLSLDLGSNIKFWQNVILDVAEYVNYAGIVSVWQIKKPFENCLYIDSENLTNYRRFTKHAKTYMTNLANLVKAITKFDEKKDCISKIDDLYKKVKSAQEKYLNVSETFHGIQASPTMDELSNNMSHHGKQNAIKNLYNFAEPKKTKSEKTSKNTLLNYKFTMGRQEGERVSGPIQNIKIINQHLEGDRLNIFQSYFNHIRSNQIDLEELRKQFEGAPRYEPDPHSVNLASIWDKDYFFSYMGHPIEMPPSCNFLSPAQLYDNVNYDINSEDQFQQLLGEDVGNASEMSSASQISNTSFIVSDDHLSDDEEPNKIEPQLKAYGFFGQRWSFGQRGSLGALERKKIQQFTILPIYKLKNGPLPLSINEDELFLAQVVPGKDKKEIMEAVQRKYEEEKFKITKAKVEQFLKKNCTKVKINDKIIYQLLPEGTSRTSQPSKKSEKVSFQEDKSLDPEPETEHEGHYSVPEPRITQNDSTGLNSQDDNTRKSKRIRDRSSRYRNRSLSQRQK